MRSAYGSLALVLTLMVSAVLITFRPYEPVWDQTFIVKADVALYRAQGVWQFHYPQLQHSGGVTASLIAGLYKLVVPLSSPVILNTHIRILAMLFFVVSACVLARGMLPSEPFRLLFLAFLITSQYPFLWLSSELIAAGFLALSIHGMVRGLPEPVTAALLVLLAFTKVELLLPAAVLLGYWSYSAASVRIQMLRILQFLLFAVLLNIPGVVVHGVQGHVGGGRGFQSFSHHYSLLVAPHQIAEPTPDLEPAQYVRTVFPRAQSVRDVVVGYPRRYLDFIALSMAASGLSVVAAFKLLLLLHGARAYRLLRLLDPPPDQFERVAYLTLLGLLPVLLFAFVHVRYLARYYPVYLTLALLLAQQIMSRRADSGSSLRLAVAALLGVSLSWQSYEMITHLLRTAASDQYWFPD